MFRSTTLVILVMTTFAGGELRAQLFRRSAGGLFNGQYQPANIQPSRQQSATQDPVPAGTYASPVPAPALPVENQPPGNQAVGSSPVSVQTVRPQDGPRLHWSQTLLQNREHDFGQVARLAKTEHVFEFVNPLDTDLYLDSVHASCKCTQPSVLTPVVKPGETARILAAFDTRGFSGQRGATVTVRMHRTQPYWETAEMTLSVKGTIRTDVVTEPGEVNFGQLKAGSSARQTLLVKYAGNPEWAIREARPSSDRIQVELVELVRDPARRRVDYQINVGTDGEMPKGDIVEHITLLTNDPATPEIVLPVQGRVRTGIEASDIRLGNLEQGKPFERKLLVRGDSAFAIVGIQVSNPKVRFQAPDNIYRTVHMLTYSIDTSSEFELDGTVVLRTTDREQPEVKVNMSAIIVNGTFVRDGHAVADGGK